MKRRSMLTLVSTILFVFLTVSIFSLTGFGRSDEVVLDQTLPVELSSFTAVVTAGMFVQLEWTAETETNMLGYNVYRSISDNLSDAVKANFAIIVAHNESVARDYTFIDKDVEYDQLYYYWLQSNDLDLTNEFHGPVSIFVEEQGDKGAVVDLPIITELRGAYPNPFNPGTNISFSIEEKCRVTLTVYNMKGQLVRKLIDNQEFPRARGHSAYWDGKDYQGNSLGSGIYLYIMEAGEEYREAKKMLLVK